VVRTKAFINFKVSGRGSMRVGKRNADKSALGNKQHELISLLATETGTNWIYDCGLVLVSQHSFPLAAKLKMSRLGFT
jgi:hypothetical protein